MNRSFIHQDSNGKSKTYLSLAHHRIIKDLQRLHCLQIDGVHVFPQENDISNVHALIIGPDNTPYEGGLFCFDIRIPPKYPFYPPVVSTLYSEDQMPFNTFRTDGQMCTSMLYSDWRPTSSLVDILVEIQSCLMYDSYQFLCEGNCEEVERTTDAIRHECIRLSVCSVMETIDANEHQLSPEFVKLLIMYFRKHYETYISDVTSRIKIDGDEISYPLNATSKRVFTFSEMKDRLQAIMKRLNETSGIKSILY